ncbi:hypothetical protein [Amycolatopsis methanolica]|uniref:hypothetical protein n=1 Tax=Amycolatopsis methanolica TaxID=1814 RepID=UPI003414B38B
MLVHYHFGSMADVLVAVLDRVGDQYAAGGAAAFAGEEPLVARWRRHRDLLIGDARARGWPKISLELCTLALNQPVLRERLGAPAGRTAGRPSRTPSAARPPAGTCR